MTCSLCYVSIVLIGCIFRKIYDVKFFYVGTFDLFVESYLKMAASSQISISRDLEEDHAMLRRPLLNHLALESRKL